MSIFKKISGIIGGALQMGIDGPKISTSGIDTILIKDKDGNAGILNIDKVTGTSIPSSSTDLANKSYVDAIGLPKKSVRVLATTNITLSGLQTVDGVSLAANERCGVIGQSNPEDNGIYDVKDGEAWVRSDDADGTPEGEVSSGMCFSVREGAIYAGWGVILITENPIDVGTTELEFTDWEPSAASVLKGTFNANTILKANSDDTPIPLTVAESTIVGRAAAGSIDDLNGAQVRTIISVEENADVTDTANVTTALNSINVNEHTDITSAGADIEDAVTKKHVVNLDTKLDNGEIEIDADDCLKIKETAYFDAEFDNGSSGAADTISWKVGNKQKSTLTDDCTYTFTAPSGPCNLIFHILQDATAGWDITWPASVKWLGSEPTWTDGGSNKTILVAFYYDGTNYWSQATSWEV